MALTEQEKQEIVNSVLNALRTESTDVKALEVVSSLNGLQGLPSMKGEQLVLAPIALLSKPATDAAAGAKAAADLAEKGADAANEAAKKAEAAAKNVEGILPDVDKMSADMDKMSTDVAGLKTKMDDAESSIAANEKGIQGLRDAVGVTIAPLDNGRIPARFIPGSMDDVKELARFVNDVPVGGRSTNSSTDVGCSVVYHEGMGTLLLHDGTGYYAMWEDYQLFGDVVQGAVRPVKDKVYVDASTNKTYRWSGSKMAVIGSDLALGYTSSTAFPGDEGATLGALAAEGMKFFGILSPSSMPYTPKGKGFYIAEQPGAYVNYGNIEVEDYGITLLTYDGQNWSKRHVMTLAQESGTAESMPMSQKAVSAALAEIAKAVTEGDADVGKTVEALEAKADGIAEDVGRLIERLEGVNGFRLMSEDEYEKLEVKEDGVIYMTYEEE